MTYKFDKWPTVAQFVLQKLRFINGNILALRFVDAFFVARP